MSGLLKTMLMSPSGGGVGKLEVKKTANIFGIGQLCSSVPFEELVVTLTSLATLSVSEIRLTASPPAAGISLCTLANEVLALTLASAYDLSTEETP